MEIQITSTDQVTKIDGVPVRLWNGVTADGLPCKVFVHRIAVANDGDTILDRELKELPPPRKMRLSDILRN